VEVEEGKMSIQEKEKLQLKSNKSKIKKII
jgi:hypothetical protein